jgi:Transketolase, C-terminal subunit
MSELVATRQAFGEGLYELMKKNDRIVALTADLGESLRMLKIRDELPERFIDTGVAEANMAGIAAGLALSGYVPVAGTFAVFLTRAFDHIRLQICQNNLHVVMVGSHGGVSNALDGGSAHALEDLAYMRTLPNMTVLFPADVNETKQALVAAVSAKGPVYLRLYREPTPVFTKPDEKFEIGKAKVVRAGKDVSIIATGPQVAFALEAAAKLKTDAIDAEVVNVHTLQPIDAKTISASAKKTGNVVTIEDHNINGGLGSAVAEVLGEYQPTPMRRIGVTQFGESGTYADLIAKLGIDAQGIYTAVKKFVG